MCAKFCRAEGHVSSQQLPPMASMNCAARLHTARQCSSIVAMLTCEGSGGTRDILRWALEGVDGGEGVRDAAKRKDEAATRGGQQASAARRVNLLEYFT